MLRSGKHARRRMVTRRISESEVEEAWSLRPVTAREPARPPHAAEVSTFVAMDLDGAGNVVGLELRCLPSAVTAEERAVLEADYPGAVKALVEVERLTRLSA